MQPPRHSGSFHADAERFGSHLTCDLIASKLGHMAGIHGARDVFVFVMHSLPSHATRMMSLSA
eukprot:10496697-Alexandrium_andersonii.AAC.1